MPEYSIIKLEPHASPEAKEAKTVRFVNDSYSLFFNAQHRLIKLSALERSFFDFLCEEMRTLDNDITIDEKLKSKFKSHLMSFTGGKKKVTSNQLTKYVQKLNGLGLILVTQNKGRYIVNPKYAFKGSKTSRLAYLKKLIEQRILKKLPVEHLVSSPVVTQ